MLSEKKEKQFWVQLKVGNIWTPRIKLGDILPEYTIGVVMRITHCLLSYSPSFTLCYPTTHPFDYYWKKHGVNQRICNFFVFIHIPPASLLSGFGLHWQGGDTQGFVKRTDKREDGTKPVS